MENKKKIKCAKKQKTEERLQKAMRNRRVDNKYE